MAYNSPFNLESLVVNTKAATIYTAQENSLFLGGAIVPHVSVPAGSIAAQVPLLGQVSATKITAEGVTDDVAATAIGDTNNIITANIYAARTVLRDLGGVDPVELGRVLGNSVSKAFDLDVIAAMEGLTTSADTDSLDMNDMFDAVAQIRGAGEFGGLYGILSPAAAAELMKNIGTNAYAGGEFQSAALRNGFVGTIAGVQVFQSAYVTASKGYIFGADAARVAMFKNVDLEVARRAEAVGNDLVASLHAGVALVDATRGVKLVDAA
jgi:hypothetical protein